MTPQQIEALKLALEALQFALQIGFDESSESQIKKGDKAGQQHRKAITAIKEALAEHAMQEVQRLGQEIEQEPVRLQCVTCGTVYADGVPPQVAQSEQEPVAWMDADGNVSDNNDHKCFPIPLYTKEQP